LPDSTWAGELNVTPDGSVPDSVITGTGNPVAFTVKVPVTPAENVAASAEVIAGAVGLAPVLAVRLTPFA
jgi:hypothetical protein